jgi:transposase-like protein
LLSGRKTAGEIEDLLKDIRKAFIESALDGELTHLLGYEKHKASGRNSGNSRNGSSRKRIKTGGVPSVGRRAFEKRVCIGR